MTKQKIQTELVAGFTTFLTMSYIIFVNPAILGDAGMDRAGVLTATVLLSFLMTLAMGLYAKLPYAVAPGMGLNAFFTYTLVIGENIPWPTALGMVFLSGVFFLIISATTLREKLVKALPNEIKIGASVGIGLFLVFIGLKNSGLVVADPATLVRMGNLSEGTLLSFLGIFIALYLMKKQSPFAFLTCIAFVSILSFLLGYVKMPETYFSAPDFKSVFFKLDILAALKFSLLPAILSMVFTDLFDSISTFVGVAKAGKLVDDKGDPIQLREGLIVDSFATLFSGIFGTSQGTTYIESASGIEAGGRTGLTSVFTSVFFLPCLFIAPLVAAVPATATAPVLICVGLMMFRSVFDIKFEKIESWVPAVLTLVLIPMTFSITKGLMWGLFAYLVLNILSGNFKKISNWMWVLGLLSAVYLFLG